MFSARKLRLSAIGIATAAMAAVSALAIQSPAAAAVPNVDVGTTGFVIAEEFEHRNYGGAELRVLLTFDCTSSGTDRDFAMANMPSGWNNVVSSFKNFHGCDANHFDGAGFTGLSTGLADSTTYIGSRMDEKTSSILFS